MRMCSIFLLLAMTLCVGCSKPTAADRDNRRLLEQLLTAITLKNVRLLDEAAATAAERHQQGHFTADQFQEISAYIGKCRQGNWQAAEVDAYDFRKRNPFVLPSQR